MFEKYFLKIFTIYVAFYSSLHGEEYIHRRTFFIDDKRHWPNFSEVFLGLKIRKIVIFLFWMTKLHVVYIVKRLQLHCIVIIKRFKIKFSSVVPQLSHNFSWGLRYYPDFKQSKLLDLIRCSFGQEVGISRLLAHNLKA